MKKTPHSLQTVIFMVLILEFGCDPFEESPKLNPVIPGEFDWSVQATETTNDLFDIHFINSSTGWAVGNQVILATSDGGITWPTPPLSSNTSTPEKLKSVFFINSTTGWMGGTVSDGDVGEIYISQQGGAYPQLQGTFATSLNSIFFLDGNNGWAAGENGDIVNTIDGGSTWNLLTNIGSIVFDIQFTTVEKGWAVGPIGALLHTKNGKDFIQEDLDITARLEAIHFTDTLNGWACGNRNTILKRHMSAQNIPVWSSVSVPDVSEVTEWIDIHFIDHINGWVISSEGKIYHTSDGGTNWINETTAVNEELNAIHMVSQTRGWVVGDNGLIMTYTP